MVEIPNTKVQVKKESMSSSGVPSLAAIQAIFIASLIERNF